MKNRSRNLARYRKQHQCSVWHTEVQLFPVGDEAEPVIIIEERLCPEDLEAQQQEHPATPDAEGPNR